MPDEQREAVDFLIKKHNLSERQACRAVNMSRTTHQVRIKDDHQIIGLLAELVDKHPSIGFSKSYHRLRKQGKTILVST